MAVVGIIGRATMRLGQNAGIRTAAAGNAAAGQRALGRTPSDLGQPHPSNLTFPTTSLIGRSAELEAIRLLTRNNRLVTLTGASGIGKSRLATQLGLDVIDQYTDGVWQVALAPVWEPTFLHETVAGTIGVREQADKSVLHAIAQFLKTKRALLVLDNCEHLLVGVSELSQHLLQECEHVHILVTSTKRLGLEHEMVYPVPSLVAPDSARVRKPEDLDIYDAARLFLERAKLDPRAITNTPDLCLEVARICDHLDGIPLAIELAAAAKHDEDLGALHSEIEEVFLQPTVGGRLALQRAQTMKLVLTWRYARLDETEKKILRRLSIFPSSWRLDSARAVCADLKVGKARFATVHRSLLDCGFIQPGLSASDGRYTFVPAVRSYLHNELVTTGEENACSSRHFKHFLDSAAQAAPRLWGDGQYDCIAALSADDDNFRSAVSWGLEHDTDPAASIDYAAYLWRYWFKRGHVSEGARFALAAVEKQGASTNHSSNAANATFGAAILARAEGRLTEAGDLLFRALSTAKSADDRRVAALATTEIGALTIDLGDTTAGIALIEDGLALSTDLGDNCGIARAALLLGEQAAGTDDHATALRLYDAAHAAALQGCEKELAIAAALEMRKLAQDAGNLDLALSMATQAHDMAVEIADIASQAMACMGLSDLARTRADHRAALKFAQAALDLSAQVGNQEGIGWALVHRGRSKLDQCDYASARSSSLEALTLFSRLGNLKDLTATFELLAAITAEQRLYARSVRLLGAADALRSVSSREMTRWESTLHDQTMAATLRELKRKDFESAWNKGTTMTMAEAIAFASNGETAL